jgi:pimeloyl-ACP methyl ester carboxylesterase
LILNFKKYGANGPNLVIIHGFLGSLDNWHTLATQLSKNFSVYTVDMRNHGKSEHAPHHSIKLMVEDLNDFFIQQNISSAYLLGHSMGGKVAMQFAIDYTDKIEKLIVADIAPRAYKRGHDLILNTLQNIDFKTITSRKEVENEITKTIPDFGTKQFLLKNLTSNENGNYRWRVNLPVLIRDYDEIIKPIKFDGVFIKPTLFIKGSLSIYINKTDEVEIQENFALAQIKTIENAGHWLHADQPAAFFELVNDFLMNN